MSGQINFDKLVTEYSKDMPIEDAILEAIESLKDANIPSQNIFLYSNQVEFGEKQKMESRCVTIENASKSQDSFVNANFALQGIKQILCCPDLKDAVTIGSWKIIQNRRLFQTILKLIPPLENDDDDDDDDEGKAMNIDSKGNDLDDSDDDDDEGGEEQDRIFSTERCFEFLSLLIRQGLATPGRIFNIEQMYEVDEGMMKILCAKLDEEMSESRIVVSILDFFIAALSSNLPHFRELLMNENSGIDLLHLTRKVNSKHDGICRSVDLILNTYC